MSSIIIFNLSKSNWLDPEWAKAETQRIQKEQLMLIDDYFPSASNKQKARKIGMSCGYYLSLRRKYGLKKRTIHGS